MIDTYMKLSVLHISESAPKGAYVARVVAPGSEYKKQKQMSLAEREPKICYDGVVLWAKREAEERGIKLVLSTQQELDDLILAGSNRTGTTRDVKEVGIFTTKARFEGALGSALKIVSSDRLRSILEAGLKLIEKSEIDAENLKKNSAEANQMIAQSMYDIWAKTGIDMTANINDRVTLGAYKLLVLKHE
jgi:hypothetical protein